MTPPQVVERTTIPGSDLGNGAGSQLRLLVIGREAYTAYDLPRAGFLTIGRAESNEVRIDDPLASRTHAKLHILPPPAIGGGLLIEDLGSVNGTRVRNRPIGRGEKVAIAPGEPINIGSSVLIVHARTHDPAHLPKNSPSTFVEARFEKETTYVGLSMRALHDLVDRTAPSQINVLITGETGVGKEVMARYVHDRSPRLNGPYVTINCATLSENLLESELFGHERGAFTGAHVTKQGLIETAAGGTLFLDEIGELPLATQAKLLRVLETREVTRIGSVRPHRIDVRFVAATNRTLEVEVESGRFRRDLFFRLNAVMLRIPALHERLDEIESLAVGFIRSICAELRRQEPVLAPDTLKALMKRPWPGNIRELRNVVERAVLLCSGHTIERVHLPEDPGAPAHLRSISPPGLPVNDVLPLPDANDDSERSRIIRSLNACAGNQTQAAKRMGMPRRTFVAKLDLYRIPRPKKRLDDTED